MNDNFKLYGSAGSEIKNRYFVVVMCLKSSKMAPTGNDQDEPNIPLQLQGKTHTDLLYESHAILKKNTT